MKILQRLSQFLPPPEGGWTRFWRDKKLGKAGRALRQEMRDLQARADAKIAKQQASCPHQQGGLGEYGGTWASIVWHRLDRGGDVIGICTECLRKFLPSDADYQKWRSHPSGNRMSTGGQEASHIADGSPNPGTPVFLEQGLDALSDEQIESLFNTTRQIAKTEGRSAAEKHLQDLINPPPVVDRPKKPRKKPAKKKSSSRKEER